MTIYYYQYQNLSYSWFLMIIFILLKPDSILAIVQTNQYPPSNASNFRPTLTTTSTVLYNNNDDSVYDGEIDNIGGDDIYDEEGEDFNENNSPSTTASQTSLRNITSQLNGETHNINDYADETGSYQEEDDGDEETHIYGDTMSVNRAQYTRSTIATDDKKSVNSQSTSRMPFVTSNLWRDLFSRPAILVGICGGIVIGMLSAILLIMFIIYRLRKRDEGSYVLDETPRKSPSHAYTRVSSREFFA